MPKEGEKPDANIKVSARFFEKTDWSFWSVGEYVERYSVVGILCKRPRDHVTLENKFRSLERATAQLSSTSDISILGLGQTFVGPLHLLVMQQHYSCCIFRKTR